MRRVTRSLWLLSLAAVPAAAQQVPAATPRAVAPPPAGAASARDAAAEVRGLADEARFLRAVNRVSLTSEQAAALLPILDAWDARRRVTEDAGATGFSGSAASLRQAIPQVQADPEREVPAESEYLRGLREYQARLADERRQAREQLLQVLGKSLTPDQARALAALVSEAELEARMTTGGRSGQGAAADVLQELERLRQANPDAYVRQRDFMARQLADAFNPQQMRGFFQQRRQQGGLGGPGGPGAFGAGAGPGGGPGLPPITDPAAQARVAQITMLLDQVRGMSPAAWKQQGGAVAAQLARDRERGRLQNLSSESQLGLFIDRYLLQPRSAAALRARFPEAAKEAAKRAGKS